jgi:hypothetical protein
MSKALARSIDRDIAVREVPKARGSAKVVARDGGSKRGLYEEVETEIAVEGGVVDDKEAIVAVRDSYVEIAVRQALEMQNSTLRGARRR